MKKPLRDIIYWAALLSTCILTVVSSVLFLWLLDVDQPKAAKGTDTIIALEEVSDQRDKQQLTDVTGEEGEFSRVLLPLGPDEGNLPGAPRIWSEFQKVSPVAGEKMAKEGFDGLQVADNVTDFSRGAISELFLAGGPRQVFRRGRFLYLLNARQKVRIIDCLDPGQPTFSGHLPYSRVRQMAMQGHIAYLLMERSDVSAGRMLVVDLKSPDKPRRLAQFDLPEGAFSFFLVDSRLLVYTVSQAYKGKNRLYVYDVNDSFQLQLLGHVENLDLSLRFLQFDQYLLVPGAAGGLTLYDFSDPLKPEQVSSLDSSYIDRMARYGDFIFATGRKGRLSVIDLSDPLRPVLTADIDAGKYLAYFMAFDKYSYFFTFDGYLQVFNLPLDTSQKNIVPTLASDGPLISLRPGSGFTLLGKAQVSLPAGISAALPELVGTKIVDHLVWQGSLVVLDDDGMVRFFRLGEDLSLTFQQSLKLFTPRRWLATGGSRLYVGGGNGIDIIAQSAEDVFSVVTKMKLSVSDTWDGLVLQNVLLLAAGKEGVLSYSLQRPDSPILSSVWTPPRYLHSQLDVSCLVAVDDVRVLFCGGTAGVFSGRVTTDKKFSMVGSFRFSSPVSAVAVHDGVGLVATGEGVYFVDVRDSRSWQNLGRISLPHVQRFAIAEPGLWAGYVDASGWSILPLPRYMLPGEIDRLQQARADSRFNPDQYRYRVHLFNEREVRIVPGVLTLPAGFPEQANGGSPHVH